MGDGYAAMPRGRRDALEGPCVVRVPDREGTVK